MAVLGIDDLSTALAFFFTSLTRIPMKRALIALSALSVSLFACIKASEPLSKKLKPLAKHEVETLPSPLAAQDRVETLPSAVEEGPCAEKPKTTTTGKPKTYEELLNEARGRPLQDLTHDLLSKEQTIWDQLPKDVANLIAQNVNSHSGVPDFICEHLDKEARLPNTEEIILHVGTTNRIFWSEDKQVMRITKWGSNAALSFTLNRQPFISRDGNMMVMEEQSDPIALTYIVVDP